MKKHIRVITVSIILILLLLLGSALPAAASSCKILVYTGEGAQNAGYTKFGAAAGKEVDTLSVLPSDLSPYCCIILPINGHYSPAFSNATTSALTSYVNSGGKIIALAEWAHFSGAITAMNGLATALGADLSIVSASIDLGLHITTNIDPSPFTVGVSSIRYGATSAVVVAVGPHAHSLVRSQGGITFIGADKIGSGWFILSGDSNVFSDNSADGYTVHDNGVLVSNICGAIEVDIDIKPGSAPNSISPDSKGVIPVAILTTENFDAADVDPDTVVFGPDEAEPVHYAIEDVDDDDDIDMILHFKTEETGIEAGDTEAALKAETWDGRDIVGTDSVRTVPPPKKSTHGGPPKPPK